MTKRTLCCMLAAGLQAGAAASVQSPAPAPTLQALPFPPPREAVAVRLVEPGLWVETGLSVSPGDRIGLGLRLRLRLRAQDDVGPQWMELESLPDGIGLEMRIGDEARPVGARFAGTADAAGPLALRLTPSPRLMQLRTPPEFEAAAEVVRPPPPPLPPPPPPIAPPEPPPAAELEGKSGTVEGPATAGELRSWWPLIAAAAVLAAGLLAALIYHLRRAGSPGAAAGAAWGLRIRPHFDPGEGGTGGESPALAAPPLGVRASLDPGEAAFDGPEPAVDMEETSDG